MKVVFIIGNSAVGKMTVGQELAKLTGLRLFHNHTIIEPVLQVFGECNFSVINDLKDVMFEHFICTDNKGLIHTFMYNFDNQYCEYYLDSIEEPFRQSNADIYYVELVASQETRLQRNKTENRLYYKLSKRDIETSEELLLQADVNGRYESYEGEFKRKNYLRINNENISAKETAKLICDHFKLL